MRRLRANSPWRPDAGPGLRPAFPATPWIRLIARLRRRPRRPVTVKRPLHRCAIILRTVLSHSSYFLHRFSACRRHSNKTYLRAVSVRLQVPCRPKLCASFRMDPQLLQATGNTYRCKSTGAGKARDWARCIDSLIALRRDVSKLLILFTQFRRNPYVAAMAVTGASGTPNEPFSINR